MRPIDHQARNLHSALVAAINNGPDVMSFPEMEIFGGGQLQEQNRSVLFSQLQVQVQHPPGQMQFQQYQQHNAINGIMTTTEKVTSSCRYIPNVTGRNFASGKLFVGGLSLKTSAQKFKEYFNMFGNVINVLIMKDPVTQRSRGFGFITFQDAKSVEKVLKVPIHTLDGKSIEPKYATPKRKPCQVNKTKKIFVGGMSQETSIEELKAYFSQFGIVREAVTLIDHQTKRHRGFGFVTFENEDIVDRVSQIRFHIIKNKKVECKKAQPKGVVAPTTHLVPNRREVGAFGVRLSAATDQVIGGPANPFAILETQVSQMYEVKTAILHTPFFVPNQAATAAPPDYGKLLIGYPQVPHYLSRNLFCGYPMIGCGLNLGFPSMPHQLC